MSKIKIFSLGGLNENGKNMYVVNVDEDIFVFDAGLKYDYDINLGIDYIIPNYNYLIENKGRIKGIFLTHGHQTNMGALTDMLPDLKGVPIYGTHLTLQILKDYLDNNTVGNFIEIEAHKSINFGTNSVFPIQVTHSIPDAVCYVLNTAAGAIVYTGDFVFDSTMLGKYHTDMGKLAYVGKKGVLCLLSESTYASRIGHTSPLNRVKSTIRDVLLKNEDRIIMTVFPAHYYRMQEIFDEVSKTHRKIIIMGKHLQNLITKAIDEEYLFLDKSKLGTIDQINNKGVIILISDGKERPFANLTKIIKGYDKFVQLKETDTIFITEPPYPGIEKLSTDTLDLIAMKGANGVMLSPKKHLLHHASSEDLMLMISLMNPKYYFPVKGEYKDTFANAEVAKSIGMKEENILLKLNGEVVLFEDGNLVETNEKIQVGDILIDGKGQDDLGDLVLKDREMLSENGIVIISCTLDKNTKEILAGPEIVTRGFIYVKESQDILEETVKIANETIISNIDKNSKRLDYAKIKNDVRVKLGNYFYSETESKPMIITVIQEV